MLCRPEHLDRNGGVLLGEAVDLFAQPVRVLDDPVGDEVRVHHPEVLVGDDERDVVAVGHDVAQQRVLEGAAAQHVAVDAFHGVSP